MAPQAGVVLVEGFPLSKPKRLVTYADLDNRDVRGRNIRARHQLELSDGRRVLLLDDRGWGSSNSFAGRSVEEIKRTTRMVVGPDEPPEGRTREEEARLHWDHLAQVAQRQGVIIGSAELRALPHDVELSEQLLTLLDE
jgi:hypothetical protein